MRGEKMVNKKEIISWADDIADAIKRADDGVIEIEDQVVSAENLNTGVIESEPTGQKNIFIKLYFAENNKIAELFTRCQSRVQYGREE
jgi:hypothetical protein